MGKTPKINSFFKRANVSPTEENVGSSVDHVTIDTPSPPTKIQRIDTVEFDINSLERDPGLRRKIWEYPVNRRDEVRRAYITLHGPNRPDLGKKYPYTLASAKARPRRFQALWFALFSWLEYSVAKNKAFCFPCFLFAPPDGSSFAGHSAFVVEGFDGWRKVNSGKTCSFRLHEGVNSDSCHRTAEHKWKEIQNPTQNIERVIVKFSAEQVLNNRIRLKISIDLVRRLAFQAMPFRGHDEKSTSNNRGNFLEFYDLLASYNEEATKALINVPKNATYKSSDIQKEILHIFSIKVKEAIREEIGHAKFCIIVDEARDASKKEQMAVVIRFVDKNGVLRERFFGIVHVSNTMAVTLKDSICSVLNHHNLDIRNIRGQGFDGASNMRGEFHGLQALILSDCPYAYYVHCFAHRLQLALVASAKEVLPIDRFFAKLLRIVNIISASCKINDELKAAHADDIAFLISIEELETGRGLNQIGNLQRPGDTRWSSHLKSVSSLIKMYSAACMVLLNIYEDGPTSLKEEARSTHKALTSFEFVFILHLMKSMLGITNSLCLALQSKTQDILKATSMVLSTKSLLQNLRDDEFDDLVATVKLFCESRNIDIPNLNAKYSSRYDPTRGNFSVLDRYRVDIFYRAIDSQIQELNRRFDEQVMELLVLSSTLNPNCHSSIFKIDDICLLVDKFYPEDFTEFEKSNLKLELRHYENCVISLPEYKNLSSISELCQWLVETKWSTTYQLVYRIVVLVLTLPVSTATAERSFSAMNIIKTSIRNKMEADYLEDCMMMYIEKDIASKFSTETIIDAFANASSRRDIAPSTELLRPLRPLNPHLHSLKVDCSRLDDSSIKLIIEPSLNELQLYNCGDFSGRLLTEIGVCCKGLRSLYLSSVADKRGRSIHVSDLEELLCGCTELETLVLMFDVSFFLRHNFARVWALASPKLTSLEIRFISSVMVTELLTPNIGPQQLLTQARTPILPGICKLCLSVDYITDTMVATISKNLNLLTHLDLRDAPIIEPTLTFDLTNAGLQQINPHGKLKHLSLVRSQEYVYTYFKRVNDLGILLMADRCSSMESICLGGFIRVTDTGFKTILHSCSRLSKFKVTHGTQLTDLVFHDIAATSLSLTHVCLRWCNLLTRHAIIRLASNTNLSFLDLRDCRHLGDESLKSISCLSNLQTLLLDGSDITDLGLSHLKQGVMSSLVSLSVRGCKRLTDTCISLLFDGSSQLELRELDLSNLPNLSDDAILLLAKSRVPFTELRMRQCPRIGDTSVMALASMLVDEDWCRGSSLRLLDLYNCGGITQLSFRWLKKPYFPRLRWLGVTGIANRDMVDALTRNRPFLRVACRGEELGSDQWDTPDEMYTHDYEEVDELEQWLLEDDNGSGDEEMGEAENDAEVAG